MMSTWNSSWDFKDFLTKYLELTLDAWKDLTDKHLELTSGNVQVRQVWPKWLRVHDVVWINLVENTINLQKFRFRDS